MKNPFKKKAKNQKGQGMIEYIILTGLIGIFCLATFKSIGSSVKAQGKKIKTQIKNIDFGE
jgi:Flp pilus assembly pilin Flp